MIPDNAQVLDPVAGVAWYRSSAPVPYPEAVQVMESRVDAIARGLAPEAVWLLEHPPLYTAGTSAAAGELLDRTRFPVFPSGRGGRYTYHGPGQRVAYVMLDLRRRGGDVRGFVCALETWLILTLARFGVDGVRSSLGVGVWVRDQEGTLSKVAALGIRVRRWVSFHGIALNVSPDLDHFTGIVPCGISTGVRGEREGGAAGVTSLKALAVAAGMADVDAALKEAFVTVFGPGGACGCRDDEGDGTRGAHQPGV